MTWGRMRSLEAKNPDKVKQDLLSFEPCFVSGGVEALHMRVILHDTNKTHRNLGTITPILHTENQGSEKSGTCPVSHTRNCRAMPGCAPKSA